MRPKPQIFIAAFCATLALPTPSLANASTLMCVTEYGPIMSLTRHGSSVIAARYLDEGAPVDLDLEEVFGGGIVIGLVGRYSPMLSTRLEVARDFDADVRTYRGKVWPIAASNAWDVTCTEQN